MFLFVLATLIALPARADEPDRTSKAPPTSPLLAAHATLTRGSFAAVPVTRAGVMGEIRSRTLPIAGTLLLEGGRTDNGLGAHRAELAFDLRTPWPIVSASAGLHLAYAILVRTTGNDNFMRALGGDIGSFALGMHANLGGQIELGQSATLLLAVRGALEFYAGATGAMLGPQIGLLF